MVFVWVLKWVEVLVVLSDVDLMVDELGKLLEREMGLKLVALGSMSGTWLEMERVVSLDWRLVALWVAMSVVVLAAGGGCL